jgi:hypothetical protein
VLYGILNNSNSLFQIVRNLILVFIHNDPIMFQQGVEFRYLGSRQEGILWGRWFLHRFATVRWTAIIRKVSEA